MALNDVPRGMMSWLEARATGRAGAWEGQRIPQACLLGRWEYIAWMTAISSTLHHPQSPFCHDTRIPRLHHKQTQPTTNTTKMSSSNEPSKLNGQINSVVGTAEQLVGSAIETVVSVLPLPLPQCSMYTNTRDGTIADRVWSFVLLGK